MRCSASRAPRCSARQRSARAARTLCPEPGASHARSSTSSPRTRRAGRTAPWPTARLTTASARTTRPRSA
eukprot:11525067-Alexandrium_andersonii.AAC.1